jgi:exosortase A-associated hydrolase 2
MKIPQRSTSAVPFFLKAGSGERYCLYHAPHGVEECRGAFVYVHPFGEEMNKSRRMAALQARSFARAGLGVLQIDLFGCGDSCGDFADARWEIWKDDLALASDWLAQHTGRQPGVWGLRLGGLLALDFAASSARRISELLLWQPVVNGESFLTQFLRMRVASGMLANGKEKAGSTQTMRDRMRSGESLEVAGYELAPALAESMDGLNAALLLATGVPIHWFEIVAEAGRPMPPAAARVADAWEQRGVNLRQHVVPGSAFWASQEISECPELLNATTGLFSEVPC